MSNYQPKEGTGSLFKNDKKTADNQPDYRGNVMIGGNVYNLASWVKEAKTGKKFLSIKIEAIDTTNSGLKLPTVEKPENDGDLPF